MNSPAYQTTNNVGCRGRKRVLKSIKIVCPDFLTVIFNLALKKAISSWCVSTGFVSEVAKTS